MERCLYLQEKVNELQNQKEQNSREIIKHCSVLNLLEGHSRGTSNYSSEQMRNMGQLDRDRLQKIDQLKQHLQNTLSSENNMHPRRTPTKNSNHSQNIIQSSQQLSSQTPSSTPLLPPVRSPHLINIPPQFSHKETP